MRMNAVIAKYETLKSKDREKAQEYLRDQAYLKHPDERELDQLYRSEFSRPRAPDRARSDALRQLRSKKNVDLSKAADKVCSAALASWSRQRRDWLADPRTMEVLVARLEHASEKELRLLIICLGGISWMYKVRYASVRDALLEQSKDASDEIRLRIAGAIGMFGSAKVWKTVLATIDCKPRSNAQTTVAATIAKYCHIIRSKKILEDCARIMTREAQAAKSKDAERYISGAIFKLRQSGVDVPLSSLPKHVQEQVRECEKYDLHASNW